MPGKIINFIEAVALSTVPKVSLVIRKSYGMAYSNMCGTGMGADFVLAWPNAEISFMAPEVAANVVYRRKIDESTTSKLRGSWPNNKSGLPAPLGKPRVYTCWRM